MRKLDPRFWVIYLVAIAIGAFVIGPVWGVALLGASQIALCVAVGVKAPRLLRAVRKLVVFYVFLLIALVFLPGKTSQGIEVLELGFLNIKYRPTGIGTASLMIARILVVVYAAIAVRTVAEAGAFARALGSMGMPKLVAVSLDATMDLLEGEGGDGRGGGGGGGGGGGRGRRGGGGGGGGGRGRRHQQAHPDGEAPESTKSLIKTYIKAARNADTKTLSRPMAGYLDRAEQRLAERHPELEPHIARDAAVITAAAMVMMSMKMLKTVPGLPIAPGHKNVVYLPLYILCAELTKTRIGATAAGLTMGVIAFMMGDGKYGPFEIIKHVAPGVLTDLLWPFVGKLRPSVLLYSIFGIILAIGRFGAEVSIGLILGMEAEFYALIGGFGVTHLVAGAVSGFISRALLSSAAHIREATRNYDDTPTDEGDQQGAAR